MLKSRYILVILLLLTAVSVSRVLPVAKYKGTNFISKLKIPVTMDKWQGKDVSEALNINAADTNFNFVNEAVAYNYGDNKGNNLLFIILDAGNFHHPKVCFTGAGYKLKELPDTNFRLHDRTFKAHTLFTTRGDESFLSFYWIVINKNIAHEWVEQKFKQLFFSMFNKERVGLMVRLDIPSDESNISNAMIVARDFIGNLGPAFSLEHSDYIFGKN